MKTARKKNRFGLFLSIAIITTGAIFFCFPLLYLLRSAWRLDNSYASIFLNRECSELALLWPTSTTVNYPPPDGGVTRGPNLWGFRVFRRDVLGPHYWFTAFGIVFPHWAYSVPGAIFSLWGFMRLKRNKGYRGFDVTNEVR